MNKNKFLMFFFKMGLLLVATPVISANYPIDMQSFNMLPSHCQAKYAEMYKLGKVEGIVINPDMYKSELWSKRVGHAFGHFHHYCPGLIALDKLKTGRYKTPLEKSELIRNVSGNIEYTIQQTGADTQHVWIIAEANLKLAELNDLINNDKDAVNFYNKAISIYPNYIQAYVGLSDLYKKMGMRNEAQESLQKAIKLKPNSKGLKNRLARLQ